MTKHRLIYITLLTFLLTGCYTPEKRVDFELKSSDTRDQATDQKEIADGLKVVFMHGYQTQIYVMFELSKQKRKREMTCIATFSKGDSTYTKTYEASSMIIKPAFIDDQDHINWLQDDVISFELDGQLYKLYDKKCVSRAFRKLYQAAENPEL